eukprot:3286310-Prymnesium_polylepis.1
MPKRKGASRRATEGRWKRKTPDDADHPGDDAETHDAQVAHVSKGASDRPPSAAGPAVGL